MVTGRLVEESCSVFHSSTLLVTGSVVETPYSRKGYGAGAHGAWFERDIEIASRQTLGMQQGTRGADDEHFRVGRRIVKLKRPVAVACQNFSVLDEYGAHRNLASFRRRDRFLQGDVHERGLVDGFAGLAHTFRAASGLRELADGFLARAMQQEKSTIADLCGKE
jgi:hypothetical protein